MAFLSGGQLSTDKVILQFLHILTAHFPVWAEIKSSICPIFTFNDKEDIFLRLQIKVEIENMP